MSYTFKYVSVERPGIGTAKGPYLSVTLHGEGDRALNVLALIDSGADTCAMPKSVAEILGLDLSSAKESTVGTASGPVMAKKLDVNVTIHLVHGKKTILSPFSVIMSDYEPPVILGRASFFENFYITFSEKEKKFSLKPI